MPHNRFYLPESYENNNTYTIDGDELHHLKYVMRLKSHDTIELFNGFGSLAEAVIETIDKHQATITLTKVLQKEDTPPVSFALALAMIKLTRLEIAIEKCTEIGCSHFYLFDSPFSEKVSFSTNQRERLTHILVSACKQSGRLFIPEISHYTTIGDLPPHNNLIYGDTSTNAPLLQSTPFQTKDFLMVIGPEKGFHPKELDELRKRKAQGIKLAPYILRAETAAIVASSIMIQKILTL